jgi:hypothetical protein
MNFFCASRRAAAFALGVSPKGFFFENLFFS